VPNSEWPKFFPRAAVELCEITREELAFDLTAAVTKVLFHIGVKVPEISLKPQLRGHADGWTDTLVHGYITWRRRNYNCFKLGLIQLRLTSRSSTTSYADPWAVHEYAISQVTTSHETRAEIDSGVHRPTRGWRVASSLRGNVPSNPRLNRRRSCKTSSAKRSIGLLECRLPARS
jgi:hypothetical protein